MITIRTENPEDFQSIREINNTAFGRTAESILIDRLRKRDALSLSLVAVIDDKPVGHIAYSDIILDPDYPGFKATCLAPVAVLPEFQRQGIGKKLIQTSLKICSQYGYDIVILVGHPSYYPVFGFKPAKPFGLSCEFEVPDEAFMVLELKENILAGKKTMIKFQPEFQDAV